MPDLLDNASSWLADKAAAALAHAVTVRQCLGPTASLQATIGKTDFGVDDGEAVRVAFTTRDFIFRYADWLAAFGDEKPGDGWGIDEVRGGVIYHYDVVAPDRKSVV